MKTFNVVRAWAVALLMGLGVVAAQAADFTQGVSASGSTATIWFKSNVATSWVDVHYQLNGGPQQNLRMGYQSANARYEQPVQAQAGNTLSYFFTYNNGAPAYDSPRYTTTVGGSTPNDPPPPVGNGAMTLQIANATQGAFGDAQVHWAVIGYDPVTKALSWVNRSGQLVPASEADNDAAGHLVKNGQNYANYFSSMGEARSISLPRINSARLFLSLGSPMFIKINRAADGLMGFAGPDMGNPSDPNQDVYFEWVEFTLDEFGYHGNTTRVDQFGFPLRTRLVGNDGYDRTLGETQNRASIFADFEAQVPTEFRGLVQRPYRIVAPAKSSFGAAGPYSRYFDDYVNQVWATYAGTDLVFTAEAGTFRGRVIGNDFVFSKNGGPQNLYIRGRPSTQAVFEGSANLAAGESDEKVVQAQITAAFNRHLLLAVDPSQWSNSASYYPAGPANFYAKFWHDHSIDGLAYGFCYDDVRNKSTLQEHASPKSLTVTLGW